MSRFQELKERAWRNNMQLPQLGLVFHTFGNVSVIDRKRGVVAIKPSGVPYADMGPDDIVVVDLFNTIIEGILRPSSDTQTHLMLYRTFPGIGGVVHTHSTYATVWAQALKSIPVLGTTHADLCSDDIPCTGPMNDAMINWEYEEETGKQIIETFASRSYQDMPMVIVASHGPFTWGDTPEDAVYHAEMLERLAKTALLTLQVNPEVPRLNQALLDKHFQRKHGPGAYYGQGTIRNERGTRT